jgi:phage terminase large subunit
MGKIELPHNWRPRPYQEAMWAAMENGIKRAVLVWHRRAGKDLTAINWCAPEAFRRRGLYWHLFPTYSQGRKVIWEGLDNGGRPFLHAFPPETWARKLDAEMTLWLHGGSVFQVVGTDHIDRLMGANPVGVIVSEYALQNPAAWELISPILAANGGWAIFPYTPRGRNHGYDLFKYAEEHPETWFAQKLTVDDTSVVPPPMLQEEKDRMPREIYEQEYFCSFEASLVGAYYKEQLAWMYEQEPKRISDRVQWMPDKEVFTGWDLGHFDSTAIWFAQVQGGEIRFIDYYENHGEPIDHYVKYMKTLPYTFGDAFLPHDAAQTSLQTGRSTIEVMRSLGVRTILNPRVGISDQHECVRLMLRQSWIHETKCKRGVQALREYVKQSIEGERGPGGEVLYRDRPVHNWASHGASAMATAMFGFRPERIGTFQQPSTRFVI